jgi:hypothetical protein
MRRYSAEELATRYAKDFAFEPDAPVVRQSALLSEAAAWAAVEGARFREGGWYCGGQPQ